MIDLINFFAYGELMNQEYFKSQGLEYQAKYNVTLSAWRIIFNKIPLDNGGQEGLGLCNVEPTPNNAGMMLGVMYEMHKDFRPKLDEIHGHPNEYTRKVVQLTRHDFTLTKGYVYVANPERIQQGLKPNKATMKILRGARKEMDMLYFSRLMNTRTID
ncbi:MAG: gamma-glutamylcyclotransferase family protein [Nitrospinaceae bacterium]